MAEAVLLVGVLAAAYVYVANRRWKGSIDGTGLQVPAVGVASSGLQVGIYVPAMLARSQEQRRESSVPLMAAEPMHQQSDDPTPLL